MMFDQLVRGQFSLLHHCILSFCVAKVALSFYCDITCIYIDG